MLNGLITTARPKGYKMTDPDKAYHNFYNECSNLRVAYRKEASEHECKLIEARMERWQNVLESYGWHINCKHDNGSRTRIQSVRVLDANNKEHVLQVIKRVTKANGHSRIYLG